MLELKQALVEIVGIAEKYDLGLGITLSNEDSARYLFRLPSWSIVRAAADGALPASVRLENGDHAAVAYDIDIDLLDADEASRIEASIHSLQSSVGNMRRYADTIDGILTGVLRLLQKKGIEIEFREQTDAQRALNVLPQPEGRLN